MKVLVIGVGSIGKRHAANASKYADVGIVDFDINKAESVSKELNVESFGDSINKAVEWGFDGVIIATPHKYHISIAEKVLEFCSMLLIEKPISHDDDKVKEFLDYAKQLNKKVFVVCNMRFHQAVQAMKASLSLIGKPLFSRAHYGNYLPDMRPNVDYRELYVSDRDEGGVMLDGIHELDYLSWFFGSTEQVVSNVWNTGTLDIDADDYAGLIIKHNSGVRSEVHLDFLRRVKRRGCEICGTEGLIDWISEGKNPENCSVRVYTPDLGWRTVFKDENLNSFISLDKMIKEFVDVLNGKEETILQTGDEAFLTLKTVIKARNNYE
jgi:predicted dehydrogenase